MLDVPSQVVSEQNPLLNAEQQSEYQSKIGSCLWMVKSTRPDCLFAINILSRYTHLPTTNNVKAVDRVLQYFASTPEHGLIFSST